MRRASSCIGIFPAGWVPREARLFERALRKAQKEHTVPADVTIRVVTAPRLDEFGDVVRTGGASVTAAAWEALLVELMELLSRFIGAEVVVRLVDHGR
jgi:hypothetical protein